MAASRPTAGDSGRRWLVGWFVVLLASAFVLATLAQSTAGRAFAESVLYVDDDAPSGGDGSPGRPFRTLQEALDAVQPGQIIRIRSGIYASNVETRREGPVLIEPDAGASVILDGQGGRLNGPRFVHSSYTARGLEVRNTKEGVRIERARGVILEGLHIHHVKNECVRLRYQTTESIVRNSRIHDCGLDGNGEGIYLGTAPEQRYKNGGNPDETDRNLIEGNEIWAVEEGIDIKEDSSHNVVRANVVHHTTDENSGGLNVRSDDNQILGNYSYANRGAGFRFGGDIAWHPLYGDGYHYGVRNVLRDNRADGNARYGYKFMHGPQDADCSNSGEGNGGELYHFGGEPFPIPCPGTPVSTPAPIPTPDPTPTPAPSPDQDAQQPAPDTGTSAAFAASDDARVRADRPTKNFGTETKIRVDAEPETDIYLKFAVAGSAGRPVVSAKLRLYVVESGKGGMVVRSVSDTRWVESSITYANRPAIDGPVLAQVDHALSSGSWVELDVTAAVRGDGTYSFAVESLNTDGIGFASRNAKANQPQLVVTYGP
ncbi:MAG TPA: DNRLRE domain-containing protein [Gemmatimonadaceae bacterium]|nr:DNRLRE domain-containing protein [Gemmatimonadaceae bacterium]